MPNLVVNSSQQNNAKRHDFSAAMKILNDNSNIKLAEITASRCNRSSTDPRHGSQLEHGLSSTENVAERRDFSAAARIPNNDNNGSGSSISSKPLQNTANPYSRPSTEPHHSPPLDQGVFSAQPQRRVPVFTSKIRSAASTAIPARGITTNVQAAADCKSTNTTWSSQPASGGTGTAFKPTFTSTQVSSSTTTQQKKSGTVAPPVRSKPLTGTSRKNTATKPGSGCVTGPPKEPVTTQNCGHSASTVHGLGGGRTTTGKCVTNGGQHQSLSVSGATGKNTTTTTSTNREDSYHASRAGSVSLHPQMTGAKSQQEGGGGGSRMQTGAEFSVSGVVDLTIDFSTSAGQQPVSLNRHALDEPQPARGGGSKTSRDRAECPKRKLEVGADAYWKFCSCASVEHAFHSTQRTQSTQRNAADATISACILAVASADLVALVACVALVGNLAFMRQRSCP